MGILNFIFKKNKEQTEDFKNTELFLNKVLNAIKVCKIDIKKEKDKISVTEKWAKELIADIYFIPSEYWYDEIKYLEKIKEQSENKNIDSSIIIKTDKLLNDYINQINLSKSKLDFLNTLLSKYYSLQSKIENTIHKALILKNKDEYVKSIKKYRKKLDDVQNSNFDLHKIYEESEHLKILRNELNEIEEDFSVRQEVDEYINKLTNKYLDNNDFSGSVFLEEEISKIKDDLQKFTDDKDK